MDLKQATGGAITRRTAIAGGCWATAGAARPEHATSTPESNRASRCRRSVMGCYFTSARPTSTPWPPVVWWQCTASTILAPGFRRARAAPLSSMGS